MTIMKKIHRKGLGDGSVESVTEYCRQNEVLLYDPVGKTTRKKNNVFSMLSHMVIPPSGYMFHWFSFWSTVLSVAVVCTVGVWSYETMGVGRSMLYTNMISVGIVSFVMFFISDMMESRKVPPHALLTIGNDMWDYQVVRVNSKNAIFVELLSAQKILLSQDSVDAYHFGIIQQDYKDVMDSILLCDKYKKSGDLEELQESQRILQTMREALKESMGNMMREKNTPKEISSWTQPDVMHIVEKDKTDIYSLEARAQLKKETRF